MASLRDEYPAYAAFIDSQAECSPCAAKMQKARAARGKKKRTPDCPECYEQPCGAKCRAAIDALTKGNAR